MKSKKQIYLCFNCDVWKSRDSMRLVMATTSPAKVRRFIEKKIQEDSEVRYNYDGSKESKSLKADALQFRNDWKTIPLQKINDRLEGVFLDYAYDGEEI